MAFLFGATYFQVFPDIHWDPVVGNPHCSEYGTREYTAQLRGVPFLYNGMRACKETPVVIHNVTLKTPDYCEDLVSWNLDNHFDAGIYS